MKKERVKSALERLETCTTRIDHWATRADKLQDDMPQGRLKLKFSASLSTIQGNATKLHDGISRNWCNDTSTHVARLLLEQRIVRPKRNKRSLQAASLSLVAQATCFGLSLLGDCNASSQWLNSEMKIEEPPSSTGNVRVTLSIPEDDHDSANLQHITSLCNVIRPPTHEFLEFSLDEKGSIKSRHSSKGTAVEYAEQTLTLGAILPHFQAKLPFAEVYGLAITLIASVLQLNHTPWLENTWSKSDIVFARAKTNIPSTVDLTYPSLVKEFYQDSNHQRLDRTPVNRTCLNLLALAIMLLEISSGKPVEQRFGDDQINKTLPNDQSHLQLADGWLKEEKAHGRLSTAFSQAILTCLQGYLNPDASFDNDEYCNAFKENALVPLEQEMQFLLFGPLR
ncbi:unnamed protein product [Penicillium olsonii]|uniref:DUF7580 domain-containing protein n=1 Tax=Penicillium olsonii TaxID=99116 RepID=A0A9W4HU71_PENOL|nr:unnamed protein product [Penicillium olsonii]CAG8237699.1 unnamed protein product [Penicillium olsonii]